MSIDNLSNVAYKKGNLMRYTFWGSAIVCLIILSSFFVNTVNGEISAAVPKGYKFSVTDNYSEGSNIRTTYYIYDDHILVEDESFEANEVNRTVRIYDNVNTSTLEYDATDTTELCELGTCSEKPKILAVIKKLISRKVGREYIGL